MLLRRLTVASLGRAVHGSSSSWTVPTTAAVASPLRRHCCSCRSSTTTTTHVLSPSSSPAAASSLLPGRAEPPGWRRSVATAAAAGAGGGEGASDDTQEAAAAAAAAPGAALPQQNQPLEAALYLVATPIGCLEDITARALRVLAGANLILAEDTRHTGHLLQHFGIRTPTLSCHEHNEGARQASVIARLQRGEPIALVSDAGMPAISDPGAGIVAAAVAAGVRVVPVPGACAAVAALAAGGLPTTEFYFAGFLPPKSGRRQAALAQLRALPATLVLYAPPHGLAAILADVAAVLGPQRRVVVARELTKLHEEFFRGSVQEALDEFGAGGRRAARGEIVLLIEGCPAEDRLLQQAAELSGTAATAAALAGQGAGSSDDVLRQLVAQQLAQGASVSATARLLSKQLQLPRSRLYKLALEAEVAASSSPPAQSPERRV